MKRISLFSVAGALLVMSSAPLASATANGRVDEILSNMQRAAANIKTVHARLEQRKRNSQLGGRDEVQSGEILFKHIGKNNDRVRINYDRPAGQVVWVNDKQIILYQQPINQCFVTARSALAKKNQEFALFATPYSVSAGDIKSRYEVAHVGDESVDGAPAVVLELKPRGASSIQRMKWWVHTGTWLPLMSQVVEPNGDISTFILRNTKVNEGNLGNFD
ncbi:MAG TPA: outer membrane lipoprotein carrier protein LolA, partial [Blastocatellia bacterium]|nr:outer membrane lipoprotein carrier protein LolA [Blastocatellia bacterium]